MIEPLAPKSAADASPPVPDPEGDPVPLGLGAVPVDAETALLASDVTQQEVQAKARDSLLQRAKDAYFRPKSFESEKLYKALGVTAFKKLIPGSGDRAVRHGSTSVMPASGERSTRLDRLERFTRGAEAIHLGFFALMAASAVVAADARPSVAIARASIITVPNIVVNLYPIFTQRYNRLRIQGIRQRLDNHPESKPIKY